MAIVIIIFMISFRFNRTSETVPEKSVGLDADIPHSNFLYTARPSLCKFSMNLKDIGVMEMINCTILEGISPVHLKLFEP